MFIKNLNLKNFPLVFGIIFFILLSFIWLIPPLQSPDEISHLQRAYYVSNGALFLKNNQGRLGDEVDINLLKYIQEYENIPFHIFNRVENKKVEASKRLKWSDAGKVFNDDANTKYYLPSSYLPQALGLKTGRELNLSIHDTYYLARIFNIVAISLALTIGFLMVPPRPLVYALLLLPMSIFLMASSSPDGLSIALSVTAISLFIYNSSNTGLRKSNFLILAILLVIIVGIKFFMLPVFLLLIYKNISWKNFLAIIFLVLIIVIIALFFSDVFFMQSDNRLLHRPSNLMTFKYYIFHPREVFSIFHNTFMVYGKSRFIYQSFVGNLGWMDTPLVKEAYRCFTFLLISLLILTLPIPSTKQILIRVKKILISNPFKFTHGVGLVLFTISLSSALIVPMLLLISWSTFPAEEIHGIQGRYFLIPALFLAYSIPWEIKTGESCSLNKYRMFFSWAIVIAIGATSCFYLTSALLNRYFIGQ